LGDSASPIATAREPDRIKAGVIGKVHKRGAAHIVWTGEMASLCKALVVKVEFSGRVGSGGKRNNPRRVRPRKWRRWRADSYPHKLRASPIRVIPAQAGIQRRAVMFRQSESWPSAFAGVTQFCIYRAIAKIIFRP
jgi:hypothetical protein